MLEILLHAKKVQINAARGKVRTSNSNISGQGYSIKPDTEESTVNLWVNKKFSFKRHWWSLKKKKMSQHCSSQQLFLMARKIWENVSWWVCVKSVMVTLIWSSILIWVNHNIEPWCILKAPQLGHISPKLLLMIKVNSAHEWQQMSSEIILKKKKKKKFCPYFSHT